MDRPIGRWIVLAGPICWVAVGCASPTVARGQIGEGPKVPTGPIAPVNPTPIVSPDPLPPVKPGGLTATPVETASAVDSTAVVQVKVVATIAGEVIITSDEVSMMVRERAFDYYQLTGDERTKKEKEVYREELRKLIERELILHEFLSKIKKNKPQVLDELWDQAKQSAERQMKQFRVMAKLETEEKFTAFLNAKGTDPKLFRRFFERQALMTLFLNSVFKDKERSVSLQQIDQFYREHAKEFAVEDSAKWQHIFVSNARFNTPADAKKYAEWVAQQVTGGADFATMAKKHGHGESALKEGEGTGTKRGEFRPAELEETILSLKVGQASAVVATANGWNVVRVIEREMAGVKPLDEKMQMGIKAAMKDLSIKAERDKFVAELWRKHTVTVVP